MGKKEVTETYKQLGIGYARTFYGVAGKNVIGVYTDYNKMRRDTSGIPDIEFKDFTRANRALKFAKEQSFDIQANYGYASILPNKNDINKVNELIPIRTLNPKLFTKIDKGKEEL